VNRSAESVSAPQKLRTVAILLAGVVISIVGTVVLDGLMQPRDFAPTLRAALATGANTPVAPEVMQRLRRAAHITVYVANPAAGLVVGLFVGLLQKRRAIALALIALIPNFLIDLTPVHIGNWPQSAVGAAHFLIGSSLPFVTAILGVMLTRHLRRPRMSDEIQV
jgi:hypothetical protein